MPIVSAVGIAVNRHPEVGEAGDLRTRLIEQAMVAACKEAQAAGVNDDDAIRERILAARDAEIDRQAEVAAGCPG